jgi:hypothetical protein
MAIAASLNVNLTATSGAFTSTMNKAGKTMQSVGAAATGVGRLVKGFVVAAVVKKAFNFVTHAIGDVEKLAESAAKVGVSFSAINLAKLGTVQKDSANITGLFDAMKLQLLTGLAPAIQFVSDAFAKLTSTTIGGFTLMEIYGKGVATVVIVIGKAFQVVAKLMVKALIPVAEAVAGLSVMIAEAATKMGQTGIASKFQRIAGQAGAIGQSLQGIDASLKWEEIFSWPEFKATAAGIQMEAKKIKEITAPESIGFGSQASALFDFRKREAARAKQDPKQQAADKQVAILGKIDRGIARLIQLQGETTVVNA